MAKMKFSAFILATSVIICSMSNISAQQPGPHGQRTQGAEVAPAECGGGCGMRCQGGGQGAARGQASRGRMGGMRSDMVLIHSLLDSHDKIRRTFKEIPGGIESLTETDDPELVPLLQQHVAAMERRLKEGRPIHQMDPLFRAIFENASRIEMKIENTAKGVRVVETSSDAKVQDLIREHARKVDGFVKEGHTAVMGTMGGRSCRRN